VTWLTARNDFFELIRRENFARVTTGVRSPAEAKDFFFSLCVQTSCEAHPASYPVGTGGPLPGGKARPTCDADYSPPSSAEVNNAL
jgi:hypothetical protein